SRMVTASAHFTPPPQLPMASEKLPSGCAVTWYCVRKALPRRSATALQACGSGGTVASAPAAPVMAAKPLSSGMVMRMRSGWIEVLVSCVTVENESVCEAPSGAPNAPRIAPEMVTTYVEFGASGCPVGSGVGVHVTPVALAATLPAIALPLALSVTMIEEPLTEAPSTV